MGGADGGGSGQSLFVILPGATTLRPEAQTVDGSVALKGQVQLTVSNTTDRSLRGRVRVVPEGPAPAAWVDVREPERDFPPRGTHTFAVEVTLPPGTSGSFMYRPHVAWADAPDDFSYPGQVFTVEAAAPPPGRRGLPGWLLALLVLLALLALLLIGYVVVRLVRPPDPPGPRIVAEGRLTIPAEAAADLDVAGGSVAVSSQPAFGGADLQNVPGGFPVVQNVRPVNGAGLAEVVGASTPGLETCQRATYQPAGVPFGNLYVGGHLCVRTSQGNLSLVRIVRLPPSTPQAFVAEIVFTTWEE